ncbi:MAG: hypothetical protein IKT38_00130 [Clostridia bacterium]|nr:hypothetical protein [Clostridia bacterium]
MNGIKKYTSYASLIIALFLWIKSFTLQETGFEAISYVQMTVFRRLCTAENIMIEAALIVALFYAVITFAAVVLLCSALTSILHDKPLIESGRKQMLRYFGFFLLLPLLITNLSWNFIWSHLPAKTPNLITQIIEIEPILDLTAKYDGIALYITVVSAVILILLFAYGIGVISNIWFNRVCVGLWFFYAYSTIYITTAYIEYGIWFLIFISLCYMFLGAAILICRRKVEEPLVPKYELFILSSDDDEETAEDNDQEYDFSIFMPKEKEDEND